MRTSAELKDTFLPPIRIDHKILKAIDEIVETMGYRSRSDLIREAIEDKIELVKGAEILQLRSMSKEQAKKEILKSIKGKERVWVSDIADELRLDLAFTFEIINELFREGKLEEAK